jgi:hypothetical protein
MTGVCPVRGTRPVLLCILLGLWSLQAPVAVRADDLDREPIRYATAPADNAVSRLQRRIDAGEAVLAHEHHFGYLRSLLRELKVPVSSQGLVFSKTSFQRERISPRSPRAVYFGDDAYVGFCQGGEVLEVSAVDPGLGVVFYTLGQRGGGRPHFVRQTDNCVVCHASSMNQGFPGHLVRSLYVDEGGLPLLSLGSYRTDHTSPLGQRWGGWYVTGTSGNQGHLGNLVLKEDNPRLPVDNTAGRNVRDLRGRIRSAGYLAPHSDIVALLVLEHQTEMHNRIARGTLQARLALYEEADINKVLGRAADYRSESTARRLAAAGEAVVQYLLFCGEAALSSPVAGSSDFAREFAARGPRNHRGHSLRDFDLRTRLFRYPCSYLIYSPAFDAMPAPVKDHVLRRTWEVLSSKDASPEYAHLSAADRRAVLEILIDTKPGLPRYWRRPAG